MGPYLGGYKAMAQLNSRVVVLSEHHSDTLVTILTVSITVTQNVHYTED